LTDRDDISDKIKIRMREVPNYSIFDMMTLVFNGIVLTLFSRPSLFWVPKSLPFLKLGDTIYDPHFKIRKLSVFQAGLAKGWVNKIRKFKKSRLRNSRQWASATKTNYLHHYCSENGTIPDLIRYPLRVDDEGIRARILSMSDRMGLGIMFTYPDSIDGIRDLKAEFGDRGFPVAKEHANKLITLPIHSLVSQRDRTQIAALILQVNKQKPMPAP
jgi:perosamine synthetase